MQVRQPRLGELFVRVGASLAATSPVIDVDCERLNASWARDPHAPNASGSIVPVSSRDIAQAESKEDPLTGPPLLANNKMTMDLLRKPQ